MTDTLSILADLTRTSEVRAAAMLAVRTAGPSGVTAAQKQALIDAGLACTVAMNAAIAAGVSESEILAATPKQNAIFTVGVKHGIVRTR